MQAVKWGEFRLGDLFEINPTKWYKLTNEQILSDDGKVPLVSNSSTDNGVMGFSNLNANNKGNTISCSDTTLGADTMYYQKDDFIGYQHIQHLVPKFEPFNESIAMCIISACRVATANAGYDYAHKFNRDAMNATKISLPIKSRADSASHSEATAEESRLATQALDVSPVAQHDTQDIDFDFMESFIRELEEERIRELEEERIRELQSYLAVTGLQDYTLTVAEQAALNAFDSLEWQEFRIGDLFEKLNLRFKKSKFEKDTDISKIRTEVYSLPLVNAKDGDNGVMYYGKPEDFESAEMTIDIVNDGAVSTGNVYSQPQKTGVLYNAYLIKPKFTATTQTLHFFTASIFKSIKTKFGYEYKASWDRVQAENISLPVRDGKPDFAAMDTFISAVQKLVIKDVVKYADKKIAATKKAVGKSTVM